MAITFLTYIQRLCGCEKMGLAGLAPSGCRCFARISRSCEVPVPVFSQPLRGTIRAGLVVVAVATVCLSNRLSLADESAAANSARHDDIVHTLTTHEGVEFGFWGRVDNTMQP